MPRAIWSGSISFGLVNIPVKLYSAVTRKNVQFNQLDTRTGARVKQKRVDAETGEEVPWDQIVKGYELSSGRLRRRSPTTSWPRSTRRPCARSTSRSSSTSSTIDPIFYDSAYYLAPDKAVEALRPARPGHGGRRARSASPTS